MQKISIKNLKFGMRLAKNIYDKDSHLLLNKGAVLTFSYINRLEALSVPAVFIETPFINTTDFPEDVLNEQIRSEATKTITKVFSKCQLTDSIDIRAVAQMTTAIIEDLLSTKDILVQTTDIRSYDNYTFAHSVNVCVLSTMLGILLGYTKPQLHELALGALLHDIGKTKIPLEILNKRQRLSDDEFSVMKSHSIIGFDLLRKHTNISMLSMHIAFQHHEKYDGSGYPRGLKGKEIHEYARIVAIADVYDALTADRPYKNACQPHRAYQIMLQEGESHFDMELLELFFSNIAIYPIGTALQLNTGDYGIVINALKNETALPLIQIIANEKKEMIHPPIFVNLKEQETTHISRVLDENEFLLLFEEIRMRRLKNIV